MTTAIDQVFDSALSCPDQAVPDQVLPPRVLELSPVPSQIQSAASKLAGSPFQDRLEEDMRLQRERGQRALDRRLAAERLGAFSICGASADI